MLKTIKPEQLTTHLRPNPIDPVELRQVEAWVEAVRTSGEAVVRKMVERFDGRPADAPLFYGPSEFDQALRSLSEDQRRLLTRTRDRISEFATRQRESSTEIENAIPGGRVGHRIVPLDSAGCYVPGGRSPLVSSLLMSAVTARVAGVPLIWAACPRPSREILAAAAVAGADGLLAAGGAHAIAALAFGLGAIPRCAVIVGPGNRWVTAAKYVVSRWTRIDMLAGPSELVVVADQTAKAEWVAADLLAQAEHDDDARPILISFRQSLIDDVNTALQIQLQSLSTATTARNALKNGFALMAASREQAVDWIDQIAPEHLEIQLDDGESFAKSVSRCGSVFVGSAAGEVLGDYGAGPNHILPTAGTARSFSGLSVLTFLRWQTWMTIKEIGPAKSLIDDARQLAILEGLPGHARSAELRWAAD